MTLLNDLPPEDRGLLRSDALPLKVFPDNYTERLRESLAAKIPELEP